MFGTYFVCWWGNAACCSFILHWVMTTSQENEDGFVVRLAWDPALTLLLGKVLLVCWGQGLVREENTYESTYMESIEFATNIF